MGTNRWGFTDGWGEPCPDRDRRSVERYGETHQHALTCALSGGAARPPPTDSPAARCSTIPATPESAAIAGHEAFIASQNNEALALYRLAIERGGPEPALQVSIAMAQMYGGHIVNARISLDRAMGGLSDEPNLRKLRATLEAHR